MMKRLVSMALVIVMLCAAMSSFAIPASAAELTVKERNGITVRNVKTGQYLNYDYGTLKNGQPLRVWPWDGSQEQLFAIDHVSGNAYRLVTNASSAFAVDVYRGNAKLKAGQLCDIWQAGADSVAQNIVFYRCSDGSYILCMNNNKNLALSATSSKGRVKLAKFNTGDASQKWIFQDANGNPIDITKEAEEDIVTVPRSVYELSEIYRVDGVYYSLATTKQEYHAMPAGTQFYVNAETQAVVTSTVILGKILAIQAFNEERETFCKTTKSRVVAVCEALDEFTDVKGLSKIGKLVGKGAVAYIDFLKLFLAKQIDAKGLTDGIKSFGSLLLEAAALEERLEIGVVMCYTERAIDNGIAVLEATVSPLTDYDVMMAVFENYATCEASFAVVTSLTESAISEYQKQSLFDKILQGTYDATSELAEVVKNLFGDLDDLKNLAKYAEFFAKAKDIDEKIALVKKGTEVLVGSIDKGILYTGTRNKVLNSVPAIDGITLANNARKLTDETLSFDALVGKTVASIKENGSYTKWYSPVGNVSAQKYTGQCTWYALGRFYEVTGVKLTNAPHAKYWLSRNSSNKNVKVIYGASNICAQSIAVNTKGNYGHVLFVEYVVYGEDGKPQYVYFTECNMDANGVYNAGKDCVLKKMTYKQFVSQRKPAGYIVAKNSK